MKLFKMYSEVKFYLAEHSPISAMMDAQFEADSLLKALEHWDEFIKNCADDFGFDDYFIVPQIVYKDGEPMSKKYYFKVVLESDNLWNHWAC